MTLTYRERLEHIHQVKQVIDIDCDYLIEVDFSYKALGAEYDDDMIWQMKQIALSNAKLISKRFNVSTWLVVDSFNEPSGRVAVDGEYYPDPDLVTHTVEVMTNKRKIRELKHQIHMANEHSDEVYDSIINKKAGKTTMGTFDEFDENWLFEDFDNLDDAKASREETLNSLKIELDYYQKKSDKESKNL